MLQTVKFSRTYISYCTGACILVKATCGARTPLLHANTATFNNGGCPMVNSLLYTVPGWNINSHFSIQLALYPNRNMTCKCCIKSVKLTLKLSRHLKLLIIWVTQPVSPLQLHSYILHYSVQCIGPWLMLFVIINN